MESNGRLFHERVRNGFLALARQLERFRVLDGTLSVEALHARIWQELSTR
jgi:thymidylate kinase